jgi:hypothetical protein
MKTILPPSIITVEQAKNFLKALFDNGEAFHPEDNANDIEFNPPPGVEPPTAAEKALLNQLMDNIYALKEFDACEYLNDVYENFNNEQEKE